MTRDRILLAILAPIAAVVLLSLAIERAVFLADAEHVVGIVTDVRAEAARCGRRFSSNRCTVFRAQVEYDAQGERRSVLVKAGRVRGEDQPRRKARYAVGAEVPIVYSRGRPERAYRDEFTDIWGASLIALLANLAILAGLFHVRQHGARTRGRP